MKKSTITTAILAGAIMLPMISSAGSCCPAPAPTKKEVATVVADDAKKDEAKVVAQTKCPVMGGKINKKQYVDHGGKRIYVCCPGCIATIKKDPAKVIKKMEDAGITLDKTPAPKKGDKKKDAHAGHKM